MTGLRVARFRWLRALPLAVLVAATIVVFATGAYRYVSLDRLLASREWLQGTVAESRPRAILAAYGIYVGAVSLSIPVSAFLAMMCGFLFGWPTGAAIAVASATTGALIVFTIARTALADVLARRAGPRLARLAAGFDRDAFSYILFLRLLPLVPFWVTNLAAAVFGARLRAFAIATVIGIVPPSLTFAVTGSGIDSVIAAHKEAMDVCVAEGGMMCENALTLRELLTPQLLVALAALGALALVPVIVRHRRRRSPA